MLTFQRRLTREAAHPPATHHRPPSRRVVTVLRELFPRADPTHLDIPRGIVALIEAAAVGLGVIALLMRIKGIPAWDGMYGEDFNTFFPGALEHPWHLLVPDGGYIELVPRMIAQFVTYLPLPDAAAAFAITGALIASGCGLFVFHASAGHIRRPWLRMMLALAVVLLPVAPLEIPDSAVGAPWYLLFALFWAILWRPRTRAGMAIAAVIGFATASSTVIAVVLAPLLAARALVLPHVREHAVTAGWAAGLLLQLPYVIQGNFRVGSHRPAPFPRVVAFYGHDVILPALGWHLSWRLQSYAGRNGATLLVGAFLAIVFTWILLVQGRRVRVFVVAALLTGFVFTVVCATLTWWVSIIPVTRSFESGSRYTDLPIFLIDAAAIVAVDAYLRRTRIRPLPACAAAALVVALGIGWVTDFRYLGNRSRVTDWPPTAAVWLRRCADTPAGTINLPVGGGHVTHVPCASLRR